MINLLDASTYTFIDFAVEQIAMNDLGWIGNIIKWLIEGISIAGLGVIVFTLILKTITLPLDVYSRVKMKKQSLVMKAMRPDMEKLQKQYANDKQMYSQKVMELQKANGISMFSACIPMIVTLVIFMVVFSSFSTYSQHANLSTYNNMVASYNESVENFVSQDLQGNTLHENGFLIEVLDEALIDKSVVDVDNIDFSNLSDAQKREIKNATVYRVDYDKFYSVYTSDTIIKEEDRLPDNYLQLEEADREPAVRKYVREYARRAAADYYRSKENKDVIGFIWVGSVWYPDSMLNKEVPEFTKFSSSVTRAAGGTFGTSYEQSYNEVTYYLMHDGYRNNEGKIEGNTYNGYFVLIVLAIGLMFLQQFISMRSQKDSNELSTVDGSGARTNKWMLIMMPIIYGLFSFFYSAAFSLYMITNTIYGLISTLIINKVLDLNYAKQVANGGYVAKRAGKNNKQNTRKRLK